MGQQQIVPPNVWTHIEGIEGPYYWLRHNDPINAAVTVYDSGLFTVDSLGGYEMRIEAAAPVRGT